MAPLEQYEESRGTAMDCSDSSASGAEDDNDRSIAKGGVTTPFPWKLHDMLDDMAKEGNHSVVTWQPHGRAFMVHKPKEFVEDIMAHYFNQTKYASFQRQLNLYGFSRLSHGKDKGAYYHMCFVRGDRNLCRNMIRQKIKGTKVRRSLSPEEEPNFYLSHWNKARPTSKSSPATKKRVTSVTSSGHPAPPSTSPKPARHVKQASQGKSSSLVSMMRGRKPPLPSVLRSPPAMTPLPPTPRVITQPGNTANTSSAKGGDLLFFEGQPFRYLEHMEGIPPVAPVHEQHTYKEKIHDMISSIVTMEPAWTGSQPKVCSV